MRFLFCWLDLLYSLNETKVIDTLLQQYIEFAM